MSSEVADQSTPREFEHRIVRTAVGADDRRWYLNAKLRGKVLQYVSGKSTNRSWRVWLVVGVVMLVVAGLVMGCVLLLDFNLGLPAMVVLPASTVTVAIISSGRRRRRIRRGWLCLTCEYSLVGAPLEDEDKGGGGRCPECGKWFHPGFYSQEK